ncbi:ABC-three component system protein [Paenibacillus amylolyticus]|uniref:ABC-three component system protein n=1 Tax=Paenibacillus amylolyticus TaxID=1451 RepID=UPI000FDB1BBA|nr:ABC-three component system protein [Paenibacillus amylolyticus]
MKRARNDATLSKLGDIYQQCIGLIECFKMEDEETITFELTGDITKISRNKSFQMEVKHHINETRLSDRDVEFWKTLKNWFGDFERLKEAKRLILFTTSQLLPNSPFYNWEEKEEEERFNIIKKIGEFEKEREETFRPLYNSIFLHENYNERNLKSILLRLEIMSEQQQINNIDNEFGKYISYIPYENRKNYIAYLLGIVVAKVRDKPHLWEINHKEFVELLQEATPLYAKKGSSPLITNYMHLTLPESVEEDSQHQVFVKEIKRIEYDKKITSAISDVWKLNMTLNMHYVDNLIFNKGISEYRTNLLEKLDYTKDPYIIDSLDSEQPAQIKESKKLYSTVMSWDAIPFGSISLNQPFFQRGLVHDIVNEKEFTWHVGDEK